MSKQESSTYFEKQRDLLLQEISNSIDSVVYNLDILNRSLSSSIQVGKEFDDIGRLWSNFYDGLNQYSQAKLDAKSEDQGIDEDPKVLESDESSEDKPSP
ncbi:uncharacterized protein PRCAT00001853001 [Priceomyces carsonii]|uniref:uncharacterized protein n=1 Tax=Priceomyces carsonii TaxID=28549 RepID=UPI002EDB6442|nr:unnamed protein product [Priceomyces carsonii]